MNSDAREYMEDAVLTLRGLRGNLEAASAMAEDQALKSKIEAQLSNLNSCLEECEHIAGNISRI